MFLLCDISFFIFVPIYVCIKLFWGKNTFMFDKIRMENDWPCIVCILGWLTHVRRWNKMEMINSPSLHFFAIKGEKECPKLHTSHKIFFPGYWIHLRMFSLRFSFVQMRVETSCKVWWKRKVQSLNFLWKKRKVQSCDHLFWITMDLNLLDLVL